jgi:hypothetical protein
MQENSERKIHELYNIINHSGAVRLETFQLIVY